MFNLIDGMHMNIIVSKNLAGFFHVEMGSNPPPLGDFDQRITHIASQIYLQLSEQEKLPPPRLRFVFGGESETPVHVYLLRDAQTQCELEPSKLEAVSTDIEQLKTALIGKQALHALRPSDAPEVQTVLTRFFRRLQRWFRTNQILEPAVQHFVRSSFKECTSLESLKQAWKNETGIQKLEKNLYTSLNAQCAGRELFSKSEIRALILTKLDQSYTARAKTLGSALSGQDLQFDRAIAYFDRMLTEISDEDLTYYVQAKERAETHWKEKIASMPITPILIEKLGLIPSNLITQPHLETMWKRVLTTCIEKGHLTQIDTSQSPQTLLNQTRYGDAFLRACQLLPTILKDSLQPIINSVNHDQIASKIWAQPNYLSQTSIDNSVFEINRAKVVREIILPAIVNMKKMLLENNPDFLTIAEVLLTDQQKAVKYCIENFLTCKFSSLQKKFLAESGITDKELEHCVIRALEELAIDHYQISTEQIKLLANERISLMSKPIEDIRVYSILTKILFHSYNLKNTTKFSNTDLSAIIDFTETILYSKDRIVKKHSEVEKLKITNFLKKITLSKHRKKINSELHELCCKKIPFGINFDTIKFLRDLSYNFFELKKSRELIKKTENLLNKIALNQDISLTDKLTVEEVGMLKKIGSQISKYQTLRMLKLDSPGLVFTDYESVAIKAKEVLATLEDQILSQTEYHPGDIYLHSGPLGLKYRKKTANYLQLVQYTLISPYAHAGKIFINETPLTPPHKPFPVVSHVENRYGQKPYDIGDICTSQVWRLNISPLISISFQDRLAQKLGEKWKEKLAKKYETIETEIHSKGQIREYFQIIENDTARQINAGKADFIWGGHVRKGQNDFNRLADRILGDDAEAQQHLKKMICSEFVGKTTIAALVQLNRDLVKELGLPEGTAVLELPFDKREKLSTLHPKRLLDLLMRKNCIVKVPPPPLLKQILRD